MVGIQEAVVEEVMEKFSSLRLQLLVSKGGRTICGLSFS